jgi:hypothetical protein
MELNELQYGSFLISSFHHAALITFYASLLVSRFSETYELE